MKSSAQIVGLGSGVAAAMDPAVAEELEAVVARRVGEGGVPADD